jgi:hypothetical protein
MTRNHTVRWCRTLVAPLMEGRAERMEQNEHDPRDVLEQLTVHHAPRQWSPLPPPEDFERWSQHPMRTEESLAYLHANHALPGTVEELGFGGGLRGRLNSVFARRTLRVMGRRMEEEQRLLGHLVQMTEALAKRCDELSESFSTQQVQEAANQARLAGWLSANQPGHHAAGQ